MQLTNSEWKDYCQKSEALRERGVQVGDVLMCDEGARPKSHPHTGKLHVRIILNAIIERTGPRFFIHGYQRGLVAYVPGFIQDQDETQQAMLSIYIWPDI